MKNARILAQDLYQEYSLSSSSKKMPELGTLNIQNGNEDNYYATYQQGKVNIQAQNPLTAVYGISVLEVGARSGHLPEFLGEKAPKYPLRPLWIGCSHIAQLNSVYGLAIPTFMIIQDITFDENAALHQHCKCILQMGYNAIILGRQDSSVVLPAITHSVDLNELCNFFKSYGLKVIIKVELLNQHEDKNGNGNGNCRFSESLQELLLNKNNETIDYLLWEAAFDGVEDPISTSTSTSTQYDLALAEVQKLEIALQEKISLIYFVPSPDLASAHKQTKWLTKLCDDVGKKTLIAFSALAGSFYDDHLPLHPLWEALRQSPDVSATPLMPIINGGSVKQGEGLWPVLKTELFECFFSSMRRHVFAGAIILTNGLPKKKGVLACNLWIAAQMQWREQSPALYAETWFKAFRPELEYERYEQALKTISDVARELSLLRSQLHIKEVDRISSEICRAKAEAMLSQLNFLQLIFTKDKENDKSKMQLSLADYFRFFNRDVRQTLLHIMQMLNISLPNAMNGVDVQESFWTKLLESSGAGIRGASKVSFLDKPNSESGDPRLRLILSEN